MSVLTITEPRTYSQDSPFSFFRDAAAMSVPNDPNRVHATERMERYGREVADEIRRKTPEGLRAASVIREATRCSDPREHQRDETNELRAMSSGAGSGGAFVTPIYLVGQHAAYGHNPKVFAAQLRDLQLPPYGMTVNVPAITGTASAGVLSGDGVAVVEADPTGSMLSQPVRTIAGQVTVSQLLHDRGMDSTGATFDSIVMEALTMVKDTNLDAYALSQALSGAATVAGQSSYTTAGFLQDVAAAREGLVDTLGLSLRASHAFMSDNLFGYVSRQVDSTGAPVFHTKYVPGVAPPGTSADWDPSQYDRFTGLVLPSGLLVFTDDQVPTGQIVVSRPSTILLLESPQPVFRALPQPGATSLQTALQLFEYAAVVPRFPQGTATISGAAYTGSEA